MTAGKSSDAAAWWREPLPRVKCPRRGLADVRQNPDHGKAISANQARQTGLNGSNW